MLRHDKIEDNVEAAHGEVVEKAKEVDGEGLRGGEGVHPKGCVRDEQH